jgi:hypothetical protein
MKRHTATRGLAALALGTALCATAGAPGTAAADSIPSAGRLLALVCTGDTGLDSYTVPVHIDVRVRKVFTFHLGLNGMEYFKRPNKLALEMPRIPDQSRKVFGELGTPLSWPAQYDMNVAGTTVADGRTTYHLRGVPKRAGNVDEMLVDLDGDPAAPMHVQWLMHDRSTIAMTLRSAFDGTHELPKHADLDLVAGGYKIHAAIDYGAYTVNEAVADSVFTGV